MKKQPEYPLMDGWIKIWRARTHTHTPPSGILLSHVKEGNLIICDKFGP